VENNKNIIITGGLGFIGKNFACEVSAEFDRKIIIDVVTYASDLDFFYSMLKPLGWELIVADINEIQNIPALQTLENPIIINFAAESHVDRSFSNAKHFLMTNTAGTLAVLEFCRRQKFKLIHISTDEVYGEVTGVGACENSPLMPTNPYSATKAAADMLVQTFTKCFSVNAKIIRANNIFGSRQLVEKVIPKAIMKAGQKEPFFIQGKKDLSRHFLHTKDFSRALMKILETWASCEHQIFNIAADNVVSIRTLVETIYSYQDAPLNLIQFGPDRPFNDSEYCIDDSRIRSLGWRPLECFEHKLRELCFDGEFFEGQHLS
jgi:dTDP-glucose 4,6-dehydratase